MPELVRSIATDTSTLLRKEMELARQEIVEAVTARLKAAGSMAAIGVLGMFMLIFLALAAAAALDLVLPGWASRLIVAGAFLLLAVPVALFGLRRLRRPPLAPEETKRTVKEDVQWAKQQLKR
jgi:apolipoprotein N-acyltransferase